MEDLKIEAREAMLAFNKVQTLGKKDKEGYTFQGVTAITSFDGYTISLENDHVKLYIYFHNTFKVEYSNKFQLGLFIEKIQWLTKFSP